MESEINLVFENFSSETIHCLTLKPQKWTHYRMCFCYTLYWFGLMGDAILKCKQCCGKKLSTPVPFKNNQKFLCKNEQSLVRPGNCFIRYQLLLFSTFCKKIEDVKLKAMQFWLDTRLSADATLITFSIPGFEILYLFFDNKIWGFGLVVKTFHAFTRLNMLLKSIMHVVVLWFVTSTLQTPCQKQFRLL